MMISSLLWLVHLLMVTPKSGFWIQVAPIICVPFGSGFLASRSWMVEFVLIGNNNACKTQGIGKICLKMHDGTVRELSDVRYVPDMKKNLVSLGVLESKGLKITMEGGVLKAVYGALMVFWAETITYASHLINRLHAVANEGKTPMEVWSGKPSNTCTDYKYLHIFDCLAYYHVRESKLDPRAKKVLFVGFSTGVKGY
ncbi:unnamed protein product [Prunus brigantina]